jgi:hypothetical protein
LIRRSQLRWRPIAALPRPFRCTPGRLSRGYHSQEEGLEINLRGYRPTIFVLHRGRWGTGEFRRQPFSDLEFSCKRILRFRRRQSSAKRLLRILFLQLLHKIHNSGLTSAHGQSREPILDRSEWEVDMSTAKHGQGSERGDKCRGRCNRKSSSNTPRPWREPTADAVTRSCIGSVMSIVGNIESKTSCAPSIS